METSCHSLVWIDCEMTGLDPLKDEILEVSCYLTDAHLRLLEPNGFHAVLHQPREKLDAMDEWCVRTHGQSGLTDRVLSSDNTEASVARGLLAYIRQYLPLRQQALLAGNSIHMDRQFLYTRGGPEFVWRPVLDHLHYRLMDVSTLKEAIRCWHPRGEMVLAQAPRKKGNHRAGDDILASIAEAKYYKELLFDLCQ